MLFAAAKDQQSAQILRDAGIQAGRCRGGRSGPSAMKPQSTDTADLKAMRVAGASGVGRLAEGGAAAPARQHFAQLSQALLA